MSAQDNGGPAFPFGQTDDVSGQLVNGWGSEGMTLRDYFAAQALQGMIARAPTHNMELRAADAYQYADFMLEARKR